MKSNLNFVCAYFMLATSLITCYSVLALMPSFDRTNENVTVIIGNSALLPCFISNLGDHKVYKHKYDLNFFLNDNIQ